MQVYWLLRPRVQNFPTNSFSYDTAPYARDQLARDIEAREMLADNKFLYGRR